MKIDIGCGPNKKEGFVGLDQYSFDDKVDHVVNIADETTPWPFANQTVEEAYSSHCLEHLNARGRCHFANELYRVMKPGAKATIIVPHWGSCRAYGDPTHQWPPVSEMWPLYLNKLWRIGDPDAKPNPTPANAPHTDRQYLTWGYDCDFDVMTAPAGLHPACNGRSQEWLQFAVAFYKEAITDMHILLTRR